MPLYAGKLCDANRVPESHHNHSGMTHECAAVIRLKNLIAGITATSCHPEFPHAFQALLETCRLGTQLSEFLLLLLDCFRFGLAKEVLVR